jgi:hypothetical protein
MAFLSKATEHTPGCLGEQTSILLCMRRRPAVLSSTLPCQTSRSKQMMLDPSVRIDLNQRNHTCRGFLATLLTGSLCRFHASAGMYVAVVDGVEDAKMHLHAQAAAEWHDDLVRQRGLSCITNY